MKRREQAKLHAIYEDQSEVQRRELDDRDHDVCDRVKISRSDGYRPLKLSSGCDCIIEEDGESSRHDHSRQ
jgi:hypothetical protein